MVRLSGPVGPGISSTCSGLVRLQPILQCRIHARLPSRPRGAELMHHVRRQADRDALLGGRFLRAAQAELLLKTGRQGACSGAHGLQVGRREFADFALGVSQRCAIGHGV